MCVNRFPGEVVIEDAADDADGSGANTPAGEPGDDFFSSWDKPTVKRPSNPPSRTGTPSNNPTRTASPFLAANANGGAAGRPKSPLNPAGDAPAAAPKTISSSAIRKTALTSKPKANILGAKKTKLGAKKVDASALDFDAAEKKAEEEAARKARLGYDPDEVTPSEAAIEAKQPATTAQIHQPTPVSPPKGKAMGGGGAEEVERGVRRLGFGQVGGAAPASQPKRAMGFGSTSKPVVGQFPPPSHISPSFPC
jgi:ADP-ribosylation factor GTPase-activating protein 2/3